MGSVQKKFIFHSIAPLRYTYQLSASYAYECLQYYYNCDDGFSMNIRLGIERDQQGKNIDEVRSQNGTN